MSAIKKIAITGGNGFIGQKVIALLKDFPNVDIISAVRKIDERHINKNNVRYVQLDINNSVDCENSTYILQSPDILINLAWENLDNYSATDHSEKTLINQYQFLSNMIRGGLKNLVNVGTCFEYGMASGEIDESHPTKPINPYAAAKDALRKKLECLHTECKFNLTWLRLFYMYGEGQDRRTLFSQFLEACRNLEPVFNMSGGKQLRDYLKVEDVASYITRLALMQRDLGVVNVCSGKPIAVVDLVRSWQQDYGYDIKLNLGHYPYPQHEPMAFWGSNLKLRKLIGD